ncbi:hypothetical protein Tco_0651741 [Tanacetum coccineum]|uniref:Uncharacterized protein n=1 Tax=Tanacetum coccineum TaxID=301880 RepID=A0ABQ4WVN3_9ASTR
MALGYQNPFYLKQTQQKQQILYNGNVLLEKHDPPVVYDSEETLQLAQEKADESLAKHKALEFEIGRLLRAVFSQDIMSIVQSNSVVDTSNLQTELDLEPSLQSLRNNSVVRQPNAFQSERPKFSKTRVPPKVVETHDLSNPATSNSVPTTIEPKVVKNDKVIAPGMFRINSFKTSRENKFFPINKVRASVRTNPITV